MGSIHTESPGAAILVSHLVTVTVMILVAVAVGRLQVVTPTEDEGLTWYSILAAAEVLQVHPNTIRARIRSGRVPHRQIELSGRLVYEVGIPDDDATVANAERAREAATGRIEELLRTIGRLEAERDHERAENTQLRNIVKEREGEVTALTEDLITARAVTGTLEQELESAHRRNEELAIEHGALASAHTGLQVRRDSLASEHRQALGILFAAKRYYHGSGVLPWLRRRFGRFARFEELTPNRTLSLPHPLGPDDESRSET